MRTDPLCSCAGSREVKCAVVGWRTNRSAVLCVLGRRTCHTSQSRLDCADVRIRGMPERLECVAPIESTCLDQSVDSVVVGLWLLRSSTVTVLQTIIWQ